jgi:hypothetical protein
MGFDLRGDRSQSGAVAQVAGDRMSAPAGCKLIGRWQIIEADICGRDHLALCEPATITITDNGRGETAFGASQASLGIE